MQRILGASKPHSGTYQYAPSKTILSELANHFPEDILTKFGQVPNFAESHVYNYTRQLLAQTKKNSTQNISGNGGSTFSMTASSTSTPILNGSVMSVNRQSNSSISSARNESPTNQPESSSLGTKTSAERLDLERLTLLGEIFAKIGDKKFSKEGIAELHRFQKLYPDLKQQVDERISRTGPYFQAYIKRNIDALNIAEEQNGGSNSQWESVRI